VVPGLIALGIVIAALVLGMRDVYGIAAFAFAGFALTCNLREYGVGAAARMRAHGESAPVALVRLVGGNRRRYGGYIAHIGVITVAAGITASSSFRFEREATLKPGEVMAVKGDLSVRLKQLWGKQEPQREVVGADVEVLRDSTVIGTMDPRMNFYRSQEQPVPTPSVRSRPSGDVYINLMAFTPDGKSATLRVILEPFVPWIWFGGLVVALGALVSAWPVSRRSAVRVGATVPPRAPMPSPGVGIPGAAMPMTQAPNLPTSTS